jgi:UDP-N-acetylmuramate dehydrogenase
VTVGDHGSRNGRVAVRLADLTTLHVGGPVARYLRVATTDALIDAVSESDRSGEPLLLLGGGSNLLVADEGFAGTVVHVATSGMELSPVRDDGVAELRVAAGEPWDGVVGFAVSRGLAGIEALSGIPGSTGAVPVQNVGAYGQDVAEVIERVRVWDRLERRTRVLDGPDCEFGYRWSRFKGERFRDGPRFVVLEVSFRLLAGAESAPVRYADLARALDVVIGQRAGLAAVRAAVLAVRRSKGMIVDPHDPDTHSAGSFFTNPVLPDDQAAALPADAPRWPAGDGLVKTSAAWLIERAGFGRGFGLPGPASLSTKHTLALTNRGTASAEDLLVLARQLRDGVREAFGVELVPEPVLVGCTL